MFPEGAVWTSFEFTGDAVAIVQPVLKLPNKRKRADPLVPTRLNIPLSSLTWYEKGEVDNQNALFEAQKLHPLP